MEGCRAEEIEFMGWRAVRLENGLVSVVVVPDLGGRVMSYTLGSYEYIWTNRDLAGRLFSPEENQGDGSVGAWKNYGGSKTWPSPQGWDTDEQWHGPPDPVLDTGHYFVDAMEADAQAARVQMTSPAGSSTGVQIVREISLRSGSSRVRLDLAFRNLSDRPRRWSIWDVTQLRAELVDEAGNLTHEPGCVVSAPVGQPSQHPRGFWVMFGQDDNPQWTVDAEAGLFLGHYQWEIGKVGLDSRAGWAGFANRSTGYSFAATFPVYPGAEYPDAGSAVEFWTVGRGQVANLDYEKDPCYLMECEVLSPMHTIPPGEIVSFHIEWAAARCPGPVVDVTEAGLAGRRLAARREGAYVRLNGIFGVFRPGRLVLEWCNKDGVVAGREELGEVHPLEVVTIDRLYLPAEDAAAARLIVAAGDAHWPLAGTTL